MRKKIFQNVSLWSVLFVIVVFFTVVFFSYRQMEDNMQLSVQNETRYMVAALNRLDETFMTKQVANASTNRLTLIEEDGTVLYDSNADAAKMDNHLQRKEVQHALKEGWGEDTRFSYTLGTGFYYYAIRLENGQIIRVSAITDSVWNMIMAETLIIGIIITVLLLLNIGLTRQFTAKLVKPINSLNLEHPLENTIYEELSPLLRRIHRQNEVISRQMEEIHTKHQEYLAITDNMKDGLIVTNLEEVLSLNKAVQKIYGVTDEQCIGKHIRGISDQKELLDCWEEAVYGKSAKRVLQMNQKTYEIMANPVGNSYNIEGVVLFVLDITEKAHAEARRQEFTANVSHELKTPLMSISGYAELIQHNMVRPEDVPEFANRIYGEASRLSSLVEDIIRLSKLDELDIGKAQFERLSLLEITEDVILGLEFQAKQKEVSICVEPAKEYGWIRGVYQIIYEMLYNLCSNAIKYNKESGSVKIRIIKEKESIIWSIADTGIGISKNEQERVFERFYRVDKSHNKNGELEGGTGLGLSIVKHGAILHGAQVKMESVLGEGTTIELIFGKNMFGEEL